MVSAVDRPFEHPNAPALKTTLRVLLIAEDANAADSLAKVVKSAGFGVRPTHVARPEALAEVLSQQEFELILQSIDHLAIRLEDTSARLRALHRRIPIIAVTRLPGHDPAVIMRRGAEDLVMLSNPEHLRMVIRRTAAALYGQRQVGSLQGVHRDLERRYTALLDQTELPLAYLLDGIHVFTNEAYQQLIQRNNDELSCIPFLDLLPVEERDKVKLFMQRFRHSQGASDTLEGKLVADGQPLRCTFEVSQATYEGEACLQVIIRSVKAASAITRELSYLAIYDVSSGLYTRTHLLNQLEKAVDQAHYLNEQNSFVLLRIDNHGELEARLGAIPMDVLYADIGATLKSRISLDDMLCRFDAHSYGLLTATTDHAALGAFLSRLLESVNEQLFELDGKAVPCQINAGVALVDADTDSAQTVVERATLALEKAIRKATGYEIYRPGSKEKPQKVLDNEWLDQLRQAFKENRLRLIFQPLVKLQTDGRARYSVLLRISRPDGGFIYPGEFMPSAERSGYAKGLDRWVILNALRELAELNSQGRPASLFIKLTEDTLRQEEDFLWIHNQLRESGADPAGVVFEFKASSLLVCLQQIKRLLEYLRPLGCRFSVSDFGNSLNPFQVLRHLHVDFLKLDPYFTEHIDRDQDRQKALMRLTQQAHIIGKEVIAQQVERQEQLFALKRLGVDYVQGFYLRQPAETLEFDFSSNVQLLE